jgi:hypothetical protein
MSKLPENLLILKDYGEGALQRLAFGRRIVQQAAKPVLFADELTKLRTALVKKFPEYDASAVEKVGSVGKYERMMCV